MMSFTALESAGEIKPDDNLLGFIQGMSLENAQAVALWLALATKGPVKMRYMAVLKTEGWVDLDLTYEQALAQIKPQAV